MGPPEGSVLPRLQPLLLLGLEDGAHARGALAVSMVALVDRGLEVHATELHDGAPFGSVLERREGHRSNVTAEA